MAKYNKGLPTGVDSAMDGDEEAVGEGAEAVAGGGREKGGGAERQDAMEIIQTLFLLGGRPFSALNRELVPEYFDQPQELFDEFGFRLPEEDSTDPTAEKPPLESSSHRMRWLAMAQSVHSNVEEELHWGGVDVHRLRANARFEDMVRTEGIPHSLRPFLWPKLVGAAEKRTKCPLKYAKIVRKSESGSAPGVDVQIEKDLLRTLPTHFSFSRPHSPGIAPLRRVLRALAFLFPELGYCQGMGVVAASLLLVCCEENAFWIMCSLIEDLLPPSYYSPSLLGVRSDERVLRHLIQVHMPELTELLQQQSADTTMISISWLITLLASAFQPRMLFRIWDHLFSFGPSTLFRTILAMLKLGEDTLLEPRAASRGGSDLFAAISRIPGEIGREEDLLEMAHSFEYSVTDHFVSELRRKYQGILMAESGLVGANKERDENNVPKQRVTKRKLHRSKSVIRQIFQQQDKRDLAEEEDPRTKNIRQTELVLDLRNAILQICAHFAECREEWHRERRIRSQADYSVGFDADKEREEFFHGRREGRKRARALTDFEQRDEDDLGFRKNDLIVVVSESDEHCWVGELNGRRGWFPAKFVQVIDERGKDYCASGDEAVSPRIAELVRGPFAFAFHQMLCHGFIRRSLSQFLFYAILSIRSADRSILSSGAASAHPWTFIESLSRVLIPSSASASQQKTRPAGATSKLTLCNTFRLDQDGRVLGPEELLHLAVRTIQRSHGAANAPLDAKLRSLVAFGLNEQCLHLWFHLLCHCSGQEVLRKRHFRSWSFIRSPASQQISCELKLLAQFAFNLDVDSELVSAEELARTAAGMGRLHLNGGRREEETGRKGEQLREGVQDMLIKHHLFSWDL